MRRGDLTGSGGQGSTGPPWVKSSHSKANGNCVEVAAGWSTSSASYTEGNCVEVAGCPHGEVLVRNSRDPGGAVLRFTQAEWAAFLAGARQGEFDRPGGPQ